MADIRLGEIMPQIVVAFLLLQSLRSLAVPSALADGVISVAAESFQSSVCSPTDERLQRQCFSELPADRYEVLEGANVRMRCRVNRQKGKTQWRAHSVLLGYDRSLRDWPRYSMQGDPDSGEHDLVITGVTREDTGSFECQVSPTADQPPLRRSTNLSVLVVPSKPIIFAPPGEPPPSKTGQLLIARPYLSEAGRPGDDLRLICQARGGSPPPTFEWFHNGLPVRNRMMQQQQQTSGRSPGDRSPNNRYSGILGSPYFVGTSKHLSSTVPEVGGAGAGTDGETPGDSVRDDEMTLVIPKSELLTGDRLTCLVSNKATQRATNLAEQKLLAEVIVSVQTPPGSPVILSDGNLVDSISRTEGESVNLTCQSKPPGSPPGELVWRWEKSAAQNDAASSSASFSSDKSRLPSLDQYARNSFDRTQLESHLYIPSVDRNQNGLSIVCATRHKLGVEQKVKILVNVRYDLTGVCIYKTSSGNRIPTTDDAGCPPKNSGSSSEVARVLYIHPDRQQIFACSTSDFYGQATIMWFGSRIDSDSAGPPAWQDLSNMTSIAELRRGGVNLASYIKTVSLRLPALGLPESLISRQDNEAVQLRLNALQCRGYATTLTSRSRPAESTIFDQVLLKPYVAPKTPSIRVESKRDNLVEGDILKLKCEAEDGEPDGTLTWLKANRGSNEYVPIHLLSTAEKDHNRNLLSSQLDIQLTSDDHLSSYACLATNPGFPANDQRRSEPFHVNITFRPKHIAIHRVQSSTKFPQRNRPADLEIVTTPAVAGEAGRFDSEGQRFQNSPRSISVVAGEMIALVCTAGPANPPISLKWRHLSCRPALSSLSADVATANYSFLSNDLEATAEKVCSEISRFDDVKTLPFEPSTLTSESQVSLIVQNSHHQSIIECSTGDNSARHTSVWHNEDEEDQLKTQVLLNVQFKPNFSQVLDKLSMAVSKYLPQLVVVEGANVDVDLTPLSNPPLTSVKWFQRMVESDALNPWLDITSRMIGPSSPEIARFRLPRANVDHMTSYKLTAMNSIGGTDLIFFLNVTHAPRLIGDPVINVTTSGKEAELECRVMANPPPRPSSVHWRRATGETVPKLTPSRGDSRQEVREPSSKSSLVPSISDMKCNQELLSGPIKYYVKCFSPEPFYLVSTLFITSVDPSDVGRYECVADNGIGSPVVRAIDLIYPFEPHILRIDRWMRAAPSYALTASSDPFTNRSLSSASSAGPLQPTFLICMVAAEPAPTVTWFREPANLTLVEGGQFKSTVSRVHAGRYRAALTIESVKKADFGNYFCQAKNLMGVDTGKVVLGPPTPPSPPGTPTLIKATSSSLTIGWLQGFNGGPAQTFIVKWSSTDNPGAVQSADVLEDMSSEMLKYTIENLSQLTTYRISIASKNFLYRSTSFSEPLLASTTVHVETAPNEQAMRDEARQAGSAGSNVGLTMAGVNSLQGRSAGGHSTNMTIIIIVAACFGCLIFITNLIIVGLVIHRRQQRRNSKLKRIPGTESLVKCGVIDTYPTADCYPERFANGQHVLTAYMDSGSQKDSLSQYQFEHFGQCSPNLPAEYLTSGSFFHRQSPLNVFTASSALTSGGTLPEHPMQTMQRFNSLSQSSSPLHSSRSHGIQPDPSGMGLTQLHPNYGYAEQQPQSIYLVAAPNPGMAPMRYTQEGSDDINPLALYLNSDNLDMTNQTMTQNAAGHRGIPMCGSNQGTVSPHSMTDKSVSSDRGGLFCPDQMQRVASYVNQVECFPMAQPNGVTCARSFVAPGPISTRLQNQQACHQSSPRLVSSFYAQRSEVSPAQSALGPQSVFGRRNSCATREQDGRSPLPGDKMDRKARPMVTFASETQEKQPSCPRNPPSLQETEIHDLTMSSDITTIPPPTDFGAQTSQIEDPQYPTISHASMQCNKSNTGLTRQASVSLDKPGQPGVNNVAWRPGSGCLSARLPSQRISRASILPNGQSAFSSDNEKSGVHFDVSM